jgi:hypothetical protein
VTEDNLSNIWLVYQSNKFGVNPQSYYVTYNFIAWTSPISITSDPNSNKNPSIRSLSNGTLFLAWVSNRTGNNDVWYKTNTLGVWSKDFQLTTSTASDETPSVTQDLKGNIWVFWARVVIGNAQIYDRVYTPGVGWGSEAAVTTETNPIDILPSATVTGDGRVWLAWSSHRTGSYQTWIKNFNGVTWTPDIQVVFYNGDDSGPSLVQTRDGTLWLAWSRDIPLTKTTSETDIYYKNSTNVGATWGPDTALTNTLTFDDFSPTMLQATPNDRLYTFWSSDMPAATDYGIWYESTNAILIHDLAVTSVKMNQQKLFPGGFKLVGQNGTVLLNATIMNMGDFAEQATTSFYANSTLISSSTSSLNRLQTATLFAAWNTAGANPGSYNIRIVVTVPAGEILTGNNTLTGGPVHLVPLGDVDQDCYISFLDASTVALAFQSRPGDAHWNVYADSDQDSYVSFIDVSTMAVHFGIHYPPC